MTTLAAALFNSNLQKAKLLLDNGADINAMDDGTYPIFAAVSSDDPNTLRFVIENGADVNIDNGLALSESIDYCIDGMLQNNRTTFYPEALEMVQILLENGADIEKRDSNGQKPLDLINVYATSRDAFETLKNLFRPVIVDIDLLIEYAPKP